MGKRVLRFVVCAVSVVVLAGAAWAAGKETPAQGFDIHVQVPHIMEDGSLGGPFHHYCKPISNEVFQCLLFESTDPKAKLVGIEYFVAKTLSRSEIPLILWHRHYHDHKAEIASGRLQVLDMPEDQAKKVGDAAAATDGIIFHLWQKEDKIPTGHVTFPQALGHEFPRKD